MTELLLHSNTHQDPKSSLIGLKDFITKGNKTYHYIFHSTDEKPNLDEKEFIIIPVLNNINPKAMDFVLTQVAEDYPHIDTFAINTGSSLKLFQVINGIPIQKPYFVANHNSITQHMPRNHEKHMAKVINRYPSC